MDAWELALLSRLSSPPSNHPHLVRALRVVEEAAPLAYVVLFARTASAASDDPELLAGLIEVASAGLLAVLAAGALARLLPRDRPPTNPWPSRRRASDARSFPSDHTAGAVAFAAAAGNLPAATRRTLAALAATTSASRLLLGRHWPSDVVVGGALGLVAARAAQSVPALTRPLGRAAAAILGHGSTGRRPPRASLLPHRAPQGRR